MQLTNDSEVQINITIHIKCSIMKLNTDSETVNKA
jgi:hypothetical protein